MKNVILLGATGNIGDSTLQVIRKHKDKINLIAIAAYKNFIKLALIAKEFNVKNIGIISDIAYKEAYDSLIFNKNQRIFCGLNGLIEIISIEQVDIIVFGLSGIISLIPALTALNLGKDIAVANKEIFILGGSFIMNAAKINKCKVLPIDSEHNTIFQCIESIRNKNEIKKIFLTASGGYLRDWPLKELKNVSPQEAQKHHNWKMGAKITVDCSTMSNKGLELIEARWLFDLFPDQIDAVLHRQSMVHGLVELIDGSIILRMSNRSMTVPIQHSIFYPKRYPGVFKAIDFLSSYKLQFSPIDPQRYPCFFIAKKAMILGKSYPQAFNASNEVLVNAFLKEKIKFLDISYILEDILSNTIFSLSLKNVEEAIEIDKITRKLTEEKIKLFNKR